MINGLLRLNVINNMLKESNYFSFLNGVPNCEEQERVYMTNRCAFLFSLGALPYFFIFRSLDLIVQSNNVLLIVSAMLSAIVLNRNGFFMTARYVMLCCIGFGFMYYSCSLGKDAGIQLVFFSLIAITSVFFNPVSEKKHLLAGYAISIVFIGSLEFGNYSFFERVYVTSYYLNLIYYTIVCVVSLLIIVTIRFYYLFNLQSKAVLKAANKTIKEKSKKEAELKTMQAIHGEFLPEIPQSLYGYEEYRFSGGVRVSEKEISGDFYDMQRCGKRIRGGVGDVMGKGVRSGFVAIHYMTALRQVYREDGVSMAQMAQALNEQVCKIQIDKRYCAGLIWELDVESGIFRYVHAGLEHAYILRSGTIQVLSEGGFQFGMDETDRYEEGGITLERGDRVVLATDGVSNMKDVGGKRYGVERFQALLQRCGTKEPGAIRAVIEAEMEAYQSGTGQVDDACVFVLGKVAK